MGFFTNDTAAQPGGLLALTRSRVEAVMQRCDFNFEVDEDGDIFTMFEHGVYWIVVGGRDGELLTVRGRWRGVLPASEHLEVMQLANDWNRERIWPKTYASLTESETVIPFAELNVDYETGVSDGQIEQHVRCAIGPSEGFFEVCKERFPEVAAAYSDDEEE